MKKKHLKRINNDESKTLRMMHDTENSPTIPALIRLAWLIWSQNGNPIMIDDAEMYAELKPKIQEGILLETEKGLRFIDEQSMVQAAAQYVMQNEAMLLTSAPKACFERLDEIWGKEIGKKNMVSGHVLALLHNSGRFDAYTWGRQAIEEGIRVYDVLNVLEGAVIHFQVVCAVSIFQFFTGHYESVNSGFADSLLYPKLQRWFVQHPDVALEIKRLHEAQPKESSSSLYGCALHSLIINDFSKGFGLLAVANKSPDPLIARPAVLVLGLADYSVSSRHKYLNKTTKICAEILRTPKSPLLGTAVKTLTQLVTLDEDNIVGLLDEIGEMAAPEALYSLSDFLWREENLVGEKNWFWPLVLHLTSASVENRGILNNVDMILMDWIQAPIKRPRVVQFLDIWISKQPQNAFNEGGLETYFPSTVHKLAEQAAILNHILTSWFLHDDIRYPLVAQKMLSHLRIAGITSFQLEPALIDELSQNEIRFLLRRILGYTVGDVTQIHLVFSLVYTRDAKNRTFGYIASVLEDQVGYDYPYQTIEYLKTRQDEENETSEIKALCSEIIDELQSRLATIDALPDLKEFHSSSVKMNRFWKERQRKVYQAIEEASKKSIWRQIATQIPLKGGRRTFQVINGQYTEPFELKERSHSEPLPRSEVSDPAGAARERLLYRMAKRDSP